jgi:hypothetical protein
VEEQHGISLIGGADDETARFTLFDDLKHCRLQCDYRDKPSKAPQRIFSRRSAMSAASWPGITSFHSAMAQA